MNVSRIVAQRELIRRSPCDSSRSVTKLPTIQPPVHQQPPEDHPEEAAPPVLLQTMEKHYAPISDSFRFRLGIPTPIHHRRTITTRSPRLTHLPPVPKALDQLRDIQAVRQQQTRPTPRDAAHLLELHEHKGIPWQPSDRWLRFFKTPCRMFLRAPDASNESRHIGAPLLLRPLHLRRDITHSAMRRFMIYWLPVGSSLIG